MTEPFDLVQLGAVQVALAVGADLSGGDSPHDRRSGHCLIPSSGAGENRTPVRQVVTEPDTTIPAFRLTAVGSAGRLALGPTAGSFPDVSGLSRRQWSFPTVHPRFCCRAAVIRPRAPSLVTVFLLQTDF